MYSTLTDVVYSSSTSIHFTSSYVSILTFTFQWLWTWNQNIPSQIVHGSAMAPHHPFLSQSRM